MRLPYYWRLLWRLWELVKSFCNWGKVCITHFYSVMKSDFREVSLDIFCSHCPFLLLTWSTTADWRKRERSGEIDVDDPIGLLLAAGCCHMLRHLPSTFLYVRTYTYYLHYLHFGNRDVDGDNLSATRRGQEGRMRLRTNLLITAFLPESSAGFSLSPTSL